MKPLEREKSFKQNPDPKSVRISIIIDDTEDDRKFWIYLGDCRKVGNQKLLRTEGHVFHSRFDGIGFLLKREGNNKYLLPKIDAFLLDWGF